MKSFLKATAMAALVCISLSLSGQTKILIKGGLVYDGSLDKPVITDILISGDKIIKVGKCRASEADTVIDAKGYIVTPGFIDPHSHSNGDFMKEKYKSNENYLDMGVTTVLCGVCGGSPYPIGNAYTKMEKQGIGTNCGLFLGQSPLRHAVLGDDQMRDASPEEIEKMKELVVKAMQEGAFGLSTGLYYLPGTFTKTEEVIAIASAMASYGGVYTSHIRSESKLGIGLDSSITEALRIGKEAGVQVNISHIKAQGTANGMSQQIIDKIVKAQKEGQYITADQYPYLASSTNLASATLPKWAQDGGRKAYLKRFNDPDTLPLVLAGMVDNIKSRGGADKLLITNCKIAAYNGKTVKELAEKYKLSEPEMVVKILSEATSSTANFSMTEEDVTNFMKQPWVMSCTDGSRGGHPRAFGAYPEKMHKYVLEKEVLTLEQFVHKSSGKVAKTYGIAKRGFIKEGNYADIQIFKPEEFKANATYVDAQKYATGIRYQFVNGVMTIKEGKYTGALPGRALKMDNKAKDPSIAKTLGR